jgi:hypothetical protein
MKTQIRKPAAGKTLYAAEYREGQALRQAQGDRKGSGRCTLRRGARGRQTVVGGQLPIDLVLGDRRLSTHYPLLPTCYGRRLRVGMAPGDALSFVLSGKDFRPFDKLRVGGG